MVMNENVRVVCFEITVWSKQRQPIA